jgi:hypothetical protein
VGLRLVRCYNNLPESDVNILQQSFPVVDRLCGLVVRVPGYRYRNPGSIQGATRFSEK